MRPKHYVLGPDARTAVPVDLMTWARGYERRREDRPKNARGEAIPAPGDGWARVAHDTIRHWGQSADVSTVFLGLDHSWGDGEPQIFETMVFGGALDQEQERYSTWAEAEAGHAAMVARVRASMGWWRWLAARIQAGALAFWSGQ